MFEICILFHCFVKFFAKRQEPIRLIPTMTEVLQK